MMWFSPLLLYAIQTFFFTVASHDGHSISKRRAPVFLNHGSPNAFKPTFLKAEDFERAARFPIPDQPYDPKRYIRNPTLVEGDIMGFTRESFDEFVKERQRMWKGIQNGVIGQSAIRDPTKHWPKGEVPYALSGAYTQDARTKLAEAINEYHTKSCVRFIPREPQHRNYIYIVSEGPYVCASMVGKQGGMQKVLLGAKCFQTGTIVHELLHAIGFFHEQSRPDRDQYVEIKWQNIQPGQTHNFEKYPPTRIDVLNTPYDYSSVMHYGGDYFSYNGQPTIVAKKPGVRLGQRTGFSDIDLERVNRLYNCGGVTRPPPGSTTPAPATTTTPTTPPPPTTRPPTRPGYCRFYCRGCRWCPWCYGCEVCLPCWTRG